MKKKICAATMLAAAVTLSACGSTGLSLNANWYRDTTITAGISNTYEKLSYDVSFTEGSNPTFSVDYKTGTYETVFKNSIYTWEDGTVEDVYVLTSTLSISGSYTFTATGAKQDFTDSVTSQVIFRPVTKSLFPIYSEKSYETTAPTALTPASADEMCTTYRYTDRVQYNYAGTEAVLTRTEEGEPAEKTLDLPNSGTLWDNEQLLFSIRALGYGSYSLQTLNANAQGLQLLNLTAAGQEAEYKHTLNGTEEKLGVNHFRLSLSDSMSGSAQVLTYAQKTEGPNEYRNVLLKLQTPLAYSLGSLTYTLTNAQFATK